MAGIYKITNRVNGKCYIGQSVNIDKRLRDHFRKSNSLNAPLYSAIRKYGKDSFDVCVLQTVEMCDDIKEILDELEKRYISEYESYGKGYNQTIGGDAGILGYKFTEAQRKKVSDNQNKLVTEGRLGTKVYAYNMQTKEITECKTISEAAKISGIHRSVCSRSLNKRKLKNGWMFDTELLDIANLTPTENKNNGRFEICITCKFIYKQQTFIGTVKEAASYFHISPSYIYGVIDGSRKSNCLSFVQTTKTK